MNSSNVHVATALNQRTWLLATHRIIAGEHWALFWLRLACGMLSLEVALLLAPLSLGRWRREFRFDIRVLIRRRLM